MADGMENAATAFDAVINSEPGKVSKDSMGNRAPTESLFRNVGELEVDEESPAKGGGDVAMEELSLSVEGLEIET